MGLESGAGGGRRPGAMELLMRDMGKLPPGAKGVGVDMVAPMPVDRMDFPGLGLDTVSHRVLRYTDLVARRPRAVRPPERSLEIHLTGNMERYMWSFDGQKFSAVSDDRSAERRGGKECGSTCRSRGSPEH